MYFCVGGRQPYSVIERADEVKVAYEDREILLDFVEKIPNKKVILEVPGEDFEWNLWHMYDEKFENFCVALYMLNKYDDFNKEGIKWYWPYPITSYYELQEVLTLKPAYVNLGPPLCFDLPNVQKICGDVKLRMVCNCARPDYLPDVLKLPQFFGQWVRPEDVPAYEPYVDTFEFKTDDLKKEETLLRIYSEDKNWPGNLNLLLDNLNYHVDNRGIPEDFGENRTKCRQRC